MVRMWVIAREKERDREREEDRRGYRDGSKARARARARQGRTGQAHYTYRQQGVVDRVGGGEECFDYQLQRVPSSALKMGQEAVQGGVGSDYRHRHTTATTV